MSWRFLFVIVLQLLSLFRADLVDGGDKALDRRDDNIVVDAGPPHNAPIAEGQADISHSPGL